MNLLNKLFPLIDHLYIFQLLEYDNTDFLKWFYQYPFKRNLQRKHTIVWTSKTKILFLVSCFLVIFLAFASTISQFGYLWTFPFFLLMYSLFSPAFLVTANLLLSPLEAYTKQKLINRAQRKRRKLKDLKVVAIVGSFAKTTTKNMLYTLLWKDFYTVKTPKSYNTELSVARSFLADVKDTTEIFLVEMDAYYPGENIKLCKIVKPDMAEITAIGAQHLERFASMEELAKAQLEVAPELPKNGVLFLNADDEWTQKLQANYSNDKVFFGEDLSSDVRVSNIKVSTHQTTFVLRIKNEATEIDLPIPGEHSAKNFAAAASIAHHLGLPLKTIKERAKLILPTEHRLEVRKMGHLTVIDNTYNTNPTTARASLKLLKDMPGSQKIVITPGLVELGAEGEKENKEFGKAIAELADIVVVVGEFSREPLAEGLKESGFNPEKTHFIKETKGALNLISTLAEKDAVVLMENDLPDQYF